VIAHGPDKTSTESAMAADLLPQKIDNIMAFMFESCLPIRPTQFAMEGGFLQADYDRRWDEFEKAGLP